MGTKTQIVFDTLDPDRLARFWMQALHYKLQDPPGGFPSWEAALKAMNVPEAEWNSASAIVDPEAKGPRIYFQQMDTPKPGKNRLHLDLNVSGGSAVSLEARKSQIIKEVERLIGLGATKHEAVELPPRSEMERGEYWVVMQDPEGNEFCVQ